MSVYCMTSMQRAVLADCLKDAYNAFTSDTPEAKAMRASFKPVISRVRKTKTVSAPVSAVEMEEETRCCTQSPPHPEVVKGWRRQTHIASVWP